MLKLIHTADWHLGQTLHGQPREAEHQAFLDTLLETLSERHIDALLIAGDVFDNANPSIRAQEQLYQFIRQAHQRCPQLDIVLIAGNHDSGARIELPAPLLAQFNTHALGRVHWHPSQVETPRQLDTDALRIPLTDAQGQIVAWCLALPFLRPAEVTGSGLGDDYLQGIEMVHRQLIQAAVDKRAPGQALVAMSHAHLTTGQVSEDSERPIIIGGAESISTQLFPAELAYVAMGHLHRPQQLQEHPCIRYSGSPLPMSFAETHYPHQLVEVTLEGESLANVTPIPLPHYAAMRRVPAQPAPLDTVMSALKALAQECQTSTEHHGSAPLPPERWPWLEVRVLLTQPEPNLRQQIEAVLAEAPVRLVRIQVHYAQSEHSAETPSLEQLDRLTPTDILTRHWQAQFGQAPDAELMADFQWLVEQAQADDEAFEDNPSASENPALKTSAAGDES